MSYTLIDLICMSIFYNTNYLVQVSDIRSIMFNIFDVLNVADNINSKIISRFYQLFKTPLSLLTSLELPPSFNRIRGPASYYSFNSKIYIIVPVHPYIILP